MSVTLFEDDPVNRIQNGDTLAYIVSQVDWNKVAWGDTVKIKLFPDAKAEVAELYPALNPPIWQQQQLSVDLELTADKTRYALGDEVNFTVHLKNAPLPPGDTPYNVTLPIFEDTPLFAFQNGKNVFSTGSTLGTKSLSLAPSQEVAYGFVWKAANISPGLCYIRVYLGYLAENEEATLSETIMIYVFG
jgi:hypothetical protein